MIQTIALEDVSDPAVNPDFDPNVAFFQSPRGLKTIDFARRKLARYAQSEAFSKVLTFRLMAHFAPKLSPERALIISDPKLGKKPLTALFISLTPEKGGKTIRVKVRVKEA